MKTGDSLNYAFIEYETDASCIEAYKKMNNVLIDDRRIKVDFSQSVSKLWNKFLMAPRKSAPGHINSPKLYSKPVTTLSKLFIPTGPSAFSANPNPNPQPKTVIGSDRYVSLYVRKGVLLINTYEISLF